MITTALKEASQIVEIQGAPPAAKVSEGEFRASFVAANGGDAATPKLAFDKLDLVGRVAAVAGEVAASKQVLIAAATPKASTVTTNHTTPTPFNLKAAVAREDAVANLELESGGDISAKGPVAVDVGVELRDATQSSPQTAEWIVDTATAKALGTVALDTSERAATAKTGEAKESALGSHASTHGSEVSSSARKRDAVAGSVDAAVVSTSAIHAELPAPFSPTLPVPESDGTSLAQRDSKPGVRTSVSEASDMTRSSSAAPTGPVKSGDVASDPSGLRRPAAAQTIDLQASHAAGDLTRTIQPVSVSKTKVADESAEASGLGTESLSKTGQAAVAAQQTNVRPGLMTLPSIVEEVINKPAELLQQATRNKVESGVLSDAVKAGPSTGVKPAVVEKAQTSQLHRMSPAQAQVDSQLPTAKVATSAQESPATPGDKDATQSPQVEVSGVSVASEEVPPSKVPSKVSQASVGVAGGALTNASGVESSSRTAVATAKSDKAKPADAGVDQLTAISSTVSATAIDTRSVNASSASSLPANGGADRAFPGAGVFVPAVQGATPLAPSSVHAANSGIAVAGALRTATVSEPGLPVAPIAQSHQTVLATPTSLEVGVQSGTQGWLRIRAEVGDQGGVNATLAAGSSGGRDLLHSQMPALNAFLHSEQMAVTTTVADRASLPTIGSHGGLSPGTGNQDGFGNSNSSPSSFGGGAQNHEPQRDSSKQVLNSRYTANAISYDAQSSVDVAERVALGGRASEESGQWLNVRV